MIRQQINLYVHHEKQRVPFSALICVVIFVVISLLVTGIYAREYFALQALNEQMAVKQREKADKQAEINSWRAQNKDQKADPTLIAQREQLLAEMREQQLFGWVLDQLEPEQRVYFSSLLQGLADQAINGVWLTAIRAEAGGLRVQLQGETGDAALIPRYLRRLGESDSYRAAQFGNFSIDQVEQRLRFQVSGVLKGADS